MMNWTSGDPPVVAQSALALPALCDFETDQATHLAGVRRIKAAERVDEWGFLVEHVYSAQQERRIVQQRTAAESIDSTEVCGRP